MKKFFSWVLAATFSFLCAVSAAQDNTSALVPMPNSMTRNSKGETFQINSKTTINSTLPKGSFLIEELKHIIDKHMDIALAEEGENKRNRIELVTDNTLQGKEHYTLKVDKNGITIMVSGMSPNLKFLR